MKFLLQKNGVNSLFGLALGIFVGCGVFVYHGIERLIIANKSVVHTHQVIQQLDHSMIYLLLAERQERVYFETGNSLYLQSQRKALRNAEYFVNSLKTLVANPTQLQRVLELGPLMKAYQNTVANQLETFDLKGMKAALRLTNSHANQNTISDIIHRLHDLRSTEFLLLEQRNETWLNGKANSLFVVVLASCLTVGLFLICIVILNLQLQERLRAEQKSQDEEIKLKQANENLAHSVETLEHRNRDISLLNEMTECLQSCLTAEETYSPIKSFCQQILPYSNGILYILHSSHTYLEATMSWGSPIHHDASFIPDNCWALRRNQIQYIAKPQYSVVCDHTKSTETVPYVCMPLIAHHETLGVLYLELPVIPADTKNSNALTDHLRLLLRTTAEHISLALANIRLRESLRYLSIRDPLTGLYNRRYLEETIEREFSRAERNNYSVAILMLDIDHFKHFNDTYGHDAGDYVLKNVAQVFQSFTRAGDILCRFGGEEFLIFLFNTDYNAARSYAERLRNAVNEMHLFYNAKSLGSISISLGLAVHPDDGRDPHTLIERADSALYKAKNAGRNRVVAVSEQTEA